MSNRILHKFTVKTERRFKWYYVDDVPVALAIMQHANDKDSYLSL